MKRSLRAVFLNAFSVLLWRLIAGGLLFKASLTKISPDSLFFADLKAYQLLPGWALGPFAWLMPRVELIFGGFLILGLATRASAAVCGALYAMFTVAIAQSLLRGLNIQNCGCGITGNEPASWGHVLLDLAMLAMCALVFFARTERATLDRLLARKPEQ